MKIDENQIIHSDKDEDSEEKSQKPQMKKDKDKKEEIIVETKFVVDYYSFRKYIPPKVYKEVWERNHEFMFERHIYNNRFFNFIYKLAN